MKIYFIVCRSVTVPVACPTTLLRWERILRGAFDKSRQSDSADLLHMQNLLNFTNSNFISHHNFSTFGNKEEDTFLRELRSLFLALNNLMSQQGGELLHAQVSDINIMNML